MAKAPEITILNLIAYFLELIKLDYESETNKEKTILYDICKDNKFEDDDYDYYEIAKELFFRRGKGDSNQIALNLFFNIERAKSPTIHIVLPGEMPNYNGIGVDEGFSPSEVDEEEQEVSSHYTRTFQLDYNLIITSQNKMEVAVIYHVLKCMIISCFDAFEFNNLQNLKISGKDIQFNDINTPDRFFAKGISLSCFYDTTVRKFDKAKLLNKLGIDSIEQLLDSKVLGTRVINKIIYPK